MGGVRRLDITMFNGIIVLLSHMIFIFISFWSMKAIRLEKWIRKGHIREARVLYFFLSIALGYTVSTFLLELVTTSPGTSVTYCSRDPLTVAQEIVTVRAVQSSRFTK